MDIEISQLKASELGKVILFYTKHTKLDPAVKRSSDQLVSKRLSALFSLCRSLSEYNSELDEAHYSTLRSAS